MRMRGLQKASAMWLAAGIVAALTGCDVGESASTRPQPSFSWPTALPSTAVPQTPAAPSFDPEKFAPPAVSAAALRAEFAYNPNDDLQTRIFDSSDDGQVRTQSVIYFVLHRRVTAEMFGPSSTSVLAPGLVFAHGGAPDPDAWRAEAVALAKKGYYSILPDIPMTITGNAQQDIDYVKFAVVAMRRAIEVLLAVDLNVVNPKKLAFVGHSWGGDLAEIMAGAEPLLSAVIVVSGSSRVATDMISMGTPTDGLGYMSKVSIFDGYRYMALPGKRKVLIQFGRQDDSIPDAQRDELTKSTSGSHSRKDYDAGHDLINFAPAAADRATFLAAALA